MNIYGRVSGNSYGHFFCTPERNWFYQPSTRELTYIELRRLYNKLYELNRKERNIKLNDN